MQLSESAPTERSASSPGPSSAGATQEPSAERRPDPLVLQIFPGAKGEGHLYEDAGNTLGYKSTEFAKTSFTQQRQAYGSLQIQLQPARGRFPGMADSRSYQLRLSGFWPADSIVANG